MFKSGVRRTSLLLVAAVLVILLGWFAWHAREERATLHQIHATFPGLSREQAYARILRMGLTAQGWLVTKHTAGFDGTKWPETGDAALDLHDLAVRWPSGTCGANAIAVLRFKGNRITEVQDSVHPLACL